MFKRMVFVILCLFLAGTPAWGASFSIDAASSSAASFSPADILYAPGGTLTVAFSYTNLGLQATDDIDALSFGPFMNNIGYFSVDFLSFGLTGTSVNSQVPSQAGDVYSDPLGTNTNTLIIDESALGLTPVLDNVDALDMDNPILVDFDQNGIPDAPVFFSLAPGSPSLGTNTPADIFWSQGGSFGLAMPGAAFGLAPTDDVDAMVFDSGVFDFSLAPGSPSLGPFSPADVFAGAVGYLLAGPTVSTLGLIPPDNVDAWSDSPVPIPGAVWLLGSGLVGFVGLRRKFKA